MTPRVSVVVAGGRAGDIDACVAALQRQALSAPTFEILLVGSRAGTRAQDGPAPLRTVEAELQDPASLWNAGARAALGDLLVFVPANAVPSEHLIVRHAEAHAGEAPVIVAGRILPSFGAHPLAWVAVPQPNEGEEPSLADWVGQTISVPSSVHRRIAAQPFEAGWGHEIVLVDRCRRAGIGLRWLDEPVGRRSSVTTGADALRERAEAGRGSVELYLRNPALLPELEMGRFHGRTPPAPSLRRLLLTLGAPPVPPALGALLPSGWWRERWLRFQHDYHFWRGVRRASADATVWRALARPPVILMYHAIGDPGERAGCYVVPYERFRRQMRWLAVRRYRVIGLQELLEHRRRQRPPPRRSVVITFDDGYADNHALALPVLRQHGFHATFFLVSRSIGGRNGWDTGGELAGRPMLTWGQVRDLLAKGMEIGAHTRTHPDLPALDAEAAAGEIAGARHDLETALGRPVATFAYPFGRLDQRITAAVGAAGYEGACCSRSGVNDPAVSPLLLRRVEVRGTDSLARFALAVHRGWVRRRRR